MYLRAMRAGQRVLFIQTAFIGDAILTTSMLETWRAARPFDEIHVCVRKGNESLFTAHPFVKKTWIWDKRAGGFQRYVRLIRLGFQLRSTGFDAVFTPHRHASSGWLAWCSGAPIRSGFSVHPLARLLTEVHLHRFGDGTHEIERNHDLIRSWAPKLKGPKLYPSTGDAAPWLALNATRKLRWVIMTPMSQWHTKQWPLPHWEQLIRMQLNSGPDIAVCLMGSPSDAPDLEQLALTVNSDRVEIAAGWKLLEAARAMSFAQAVVTNDSGPLHLASAVNAPTVAIFCSTSPSFGFGPLSTHSEILQVEENLSCRPCGMHGHKQCPESHFLCGVQVSAARVHQSIQRLMMPKS